MKGFAYKIDNLVDFNEEKRDKIEIPCKDLDIDCLPDDTGGIPFGNYMKCYLYDPGQGICPLAPINVSAVGKKERI